MGRYLLLLVVVMAVFQDLCEYLGVILVIVLCVLGVLSSPPCVRVLCRVYLQERVFNRLF